MPGTESEMKLLLSEKHGYLKYRGVRFWRTVERYREDEFRGENKGHFIIFLLKQS